MRPRDKGKKRVVTVLNPVGMSFHELIRLGVLKEPNEDAMAVLRTSNDLSGRRSPLFMRYNPVDDKHKVFAKLCATQQTMSHAYLLAKRYA